MNNRERIEILNDPNRLFKTKPANSINKDLNSASKIALTSIKAAEHLNSCRLFSEALDICEKILEHEAKIDDETRGLVKYHYGVALEESGDLTSAIKAYNDSYKLRQSSWPLFRLGKIHEKSDPPAAFNYYSRATINNSDLTDDASAHAETWTDSFFNKDIYKRFNPDLADLVIDLTHHYLEYGFKEGRIAGKGQILNEIERIKGEIEDNFSWKLYLDANPDLEVLVKDNGISLAEAEYTLIRHYIEYEW